MVDVSGKARPRTTGTMMNLLGVCGWLVAIALLTQQQRSSITRSVGSMDTPPDQQSDIVTYTEFKEQMNTLKSKLQEQQATMDALSKLLQEKHQETMGQFGSFAQQQKTMDALNKLLQEKHQETMGQLGNLATKQDVTTATTSATNAILSARPTASNGGTKAADATHDNNEPMKKEITVTSSASQSGTIDPIFQRALLNNPPIPSSAGRLTQTADLTPFQEVKRSSSRATDNEDYDMIHHFFWGQENGIVMELGALDGLQWSISRAFLPMHWHRLLVEANPLHAANGPTKSPDATYVHGAICDGGMVHYLAQGESVVNGIAEFMSPGFLKSYHRQIHDATEGGKNINAVDWAEWNKLEDHKDKVHEVPCLSLNTIFDHLGLKRINFFMLDTEGAELNILQSLDFSKIQFDVLLVETEPFAPNLRTVGYAQKVVDLVTSKGYVHDRNAGRNSWFRHPSFVPVKDPDLKEA